MQAFAGRSVWALRKRSSSTAGEEAQPIGPVIVGATWNARQRSSSPSARVLVVSSVVKAAVSSRSSDTPERPCAKWRS